MWWGEGQKVYMGRGPLCFGRSFVIGVLHQTFPILNGMILHDTEVVSGAYRERKRLCTDKVALVYN